MSAFLAVLMTLLCLLPFALCRKATFRIGCSSFREFPEEVAWCPNERPVALATSHFRWPQRDMQRYTDWSLVNSLLTSDYVTTSLRRRKYFMMGNSVMRHYARILSSYLETGSVTSDAFRVEYDRVDEKNSCHTLGLDSCASAHDVYFFWKNHFGAETADDARDICMTTAFGGDASASERVSHDTLRCLRRLFEVNFRASRDDVLIVTSLALNSTTFRAEMRGDPDALFAQVALRWTISAAEGCDHRVLVHILLDAFPGAIVWVNYPHLVMNKNIFKNSDNYNDCFRFMNRKTNCATTYFDRVLFLDFQQYQLSRESDYNDIIHHGGELAFHIVQSMLVALKPI